MLIFNDDFLGIGLHTCGSAEDYRYIVEKSNKKFEETMGPFLDYIPDKFKPSNSTSNYKNRTNNKSNKNYYNSNNSRKEKVKEQKRTELNQEEIELIMKEMYKETKNIINNIVKNLSK